VGFVLWLTFNTDSTVKATCRIAWLSYEARAWFGNLSRAARGWMPNSIDMKPTTTVNSRVDPARNKVRYVV
jgi:hypothetical protein